MTQPYKILVGWDGSDQARKALKHAFGMAKRRGLSKITVAYAVKKESELIGSLLDSYKLEIPEGLEELKHSKQRNLLKEAEEIGDQENIEIEARLLKSMNGPAASIVKFAEENDFDHVVIGFRGETGISRILLGTVAEKIVRRAHCSVTVVR